MTKIDRFDRIIYALERKVVGWISLGMALIVFLDVVHRIFSRTPGRLSAMLNLEPVTASIIIFIAVWVLAYGAIRTREGKKIKAARVLLRSLAATILLGLSIEAFTRWMPEGLVWSPYLGLSALLWIGLLGASMATRMGQHLSLELGEKLWPARLLAPVRRVNGLIVGAFCALLAVLAGNSIGDHFQDWRSGPGAGLIPAIGWPKWSVFVVIPYSFSMMALRFWAQAFGWTKKEEPRT